MLNDNYFFSFTAGYPDAEGSIGIYNHQARFRIGSYDKKLLQQTHQRFLLLGIKNSFRLETKAGVHGGRKHNGDFWRVDLMDKKSIFICLNRLLPYLRHKKRKNAAKFAIENTISRM